MPATHFRFGSLALGLAALLLTAFPLVRPFFRLDPREPAETLAAASPFVVLSIYPAIDMIYRGPAVAVFVMALLLMAIGAATFSAAIWRSRILPRPAAILFATGLALWFPPFPEVVRIADGIVIGVGGVWLAASLWQRASDRQVT